MGLLAALVSLAWPALHGLHENYLLETTARDIVDCMAFARSGAIADQTPYQLVFQAGPASFRLYKTTTQDPSTALIPVSGRWGREVRIDETLQLQVPQAAVLFYANGDSGPVELTLQSRSHRGLVIDWSGALGYASIKESVPS